MSTLFLLQLLLLPGLADPAVTITLQPQVTISTADITLPQIATLHASGEQLLTLQKVSLGSAPLPGATRTIAVDYVCLRLRRYGIDPTKVQLEGGAVVVRREGPAAPQSPAPTSPLTRPTTPAAATAAPAADTTPPTIRRNQLVEIEVLCGGVAIRAAGRAMMDGQVGDLINVQIQRTNQTLQAQVTGPGHLACTLAGGEE